MDDRNEVISHMQIIRTWADFALEYDAIFLNKEHFESITKWIDEVLELLNKEAL